MNSCCSFASVKGRRIYFFSFYLLKEQNEQQLNIHFTYVTTDVRTAPRKNTGDWPRYVVIENIVCKLEIQTKLIKRDFDHKSESRFSFGINAPVY